MTNNGGHIVHWTAVYGINDNAVRIQYDQPWDEFASMLLEPPKTTEDKTEALLIVPCRFKTIDDEGYEPVPDVDGREAPRDPETGKPYPRRCGTNLIETSMLFVDYDANVSIDEAKNHFRKFEHVGYTTWSHRTPKKNGNDAFRIVLPLHKPIGKYEFIERRAAMLAFMGKADKSTFSQTRGFYAPSCSEDMLCFAMSWRNEGQLFNWELFEAVPPVEITPFVPPKGQNTDDAEKLNQRLLERLVLRGQQGMPYELWFRVGTVMKRVGYSMQDFHAVTYADPNARSHRSRATEGEFQRAWRSFNTGATARGYAWLWKVAKNEVQA